MNQLEFLTLGSPEEIRDPLLAVLEGFELPCQPQILAWDEAWEELARIGLYRFGPDISQVGTTWLDGLVSTGGLRPFTAREIDEMGGPSVFLPPLWQAVHVPATKGIWAVPWLADVRAIFYWRDMLEQVGIDEETAFRTPEQVVQSMERLRAGGAEAQLSSWTLGPLVMLQNAATWVWQAGADFVSADGEQITFHEPEAIEGLVSFLSLHRYSSRAVELDPLGMFIRRQVAVVMAPCGRITLFERQLEQRPDLVARLGVAGPPGPAFVGGSLLVVWQHSRRPADAVALVSFLTSLRAQLAYSQMASLWSVRLDALAEPPYATDPRYRVMGEALKAGRGYPAIRKWGIIENKLGKVLARLWESLLEDPDQNLKALVESELGSLAQRLTVTLGGRK